MFKDALGAVVAVSCRLICVMGAQETLRIVIDQSQGDVLFVLGKLCKELASKARIRKRLRLKVLTAEVKELLNRCELAGPWSLVMEPNSREALALELLRDEVNRKTIAVHIRDRMNQIEELF